MDGLQLGKMIREHMPWIKIIILSGHDEFEYAQKAIKLGLKNTCKTYHSTGYARSPSENLLLSLIRSERTGKIRRNAGAIGREPGMSSGKNFYLMGHWSN